MRWSAREGSSEALTGARAGWATEPRKCVHSRAPTPYACVEGHTHTVVIYRETMWGPARSEKRLSDARKLATADTADEKKVELIKLAVMAYQHRSGTLELMGEDANGRKLYLSDVSQAALLFVPRETLPYLRRNQQLWGRVKNPEATGDERSSSRKALPTGRGILADLLVGPIMDSINAEAASLLPGKFRLNVVDTYADAQMKIKGLGLFGL